MTVAVVTLAIVAALGWAIVLYLLRLLRDAYDQIVSMVAPDVAGALATARRSRRGYNRGRRRRQREHADRMADAITEAP